MYVLVACGLLLNVVLLSYGYKTKTGKCHLVLMLIVYRHIRVQDILQEMRDLLSSSEY